MQIKLSTLLLTQKMLNTQINATTELQFQRTYENAHKNELHSLQLEITELTNALEDITAALESTYTDEQIRQHNIAMDIMHNYRDAFPKF